MFTIVLVCLENFQEYILTNIAQLIKLGHNNTNIFVLTNDHLMPEFEPFADMVTLVSVETLDDPFHFNSRSQLERQFRNGFWHHTSARLFVLHAFMQKFGVTNVIHIENDVLLYYNCDDTIGHALYNAQHLYIPFDTFERNIASIVYIPDGDIFGQILSHYDFGKNDMYNFSEIRKKTGLIRTFPIFVSEGDEIEERAFVCTGYNKFGGYIFDAAAIGQYVGGVDPRNTPGDTRGFVNETCVIKYADEGEIMWTTEDASGFRKPFLKIKGSNTKVPIFNLHIHSKNLHLYV
jgi:hypothetical protein